MLHRYCKLEFCIVKIMVDFRCVSSMCDLEYKSCKALIEALESVELTALAMCQNDANLVSADAVIGFLLNDSNAQTKTNFFANQIRYKKGSGLVNAETILQQDEISANKLSNAAMNANAN